MQRPMTDETGVVWGCCLEKREQTNLLTRTDQLLRHLKSHNAAQTVAAKQIDSMGLNGMHGLHISLRHVLH
jgi:hypothetical protein